MIKKVLGIIVAVLAIAVIVIAVLHRGKYASLVFREPEAETVFEATAENRTDASATGPETDSTAIRTTDVPVPPDSLHMGKGTEY